MHQHIRRLKEHRNVLYGAVCFLFLVQLIALITLSAQLSQVRTAQIVSASETQRSLDEAQEAHQYQIQEIARVMSAQRTDLEGQITLLRASNDFSGTVNEVIRGVVSINTDKSAGTGFIVHSSGYIVTNHHVIADARQIQAIDRNGRTHEATVIADDSEKDLALLKVDGTFDAIPLADSDSVVIGSKVIAIGNPLGLSFSVTEGIVSAVDRQGPNGLANYIQTDVTLNRGNSGGPLINTAGQVIGVNNFKIGEAEGLGFALESNIVRDFIASHIPN
jgi:S1-C subfamily serine protease